VLAHATANQAWQDGQKISLALPANTFTDPQGQKLAYSAFQVNGTSALSWLSFNPGTDTFSGVVPKTATGTIELEVLATNSSGLTAKDLFYVSLGTSVPVTGVAHGMVATEGLTDGVEVALIGQAAPHYQPHLALA
jgi:hypothetical protein